MVDDIVFMNKVNITIQKIKKKSSPKEKAQVHFIVLCIAKVIKLMISKAIVLCVEWTWWKNKINQQLQQNNGRVQCTLKLLKMNQVRVLSVVWI